MSRSKRSIPIERLTVVTLSEVARELGVSAMRVYQIEKAALEKLRVAFVERKIVTGKGRYSV